MVKRVLNALTHTVDSSHKLCNFLFHCNRHTLTTKRGRRSEVPLADYQSDSGKKTINRPSRRRKQSAGPIWARESPVAAACSSFPPATARQAPLLAGARLSSSSPDRRVEALSSSPTGTQNHRQALFTAPPLATPPQPWPSSPPSSSPSRSPGFASATTPRSFPRAAPRSSGSAPRHSRMPCRQTSRPRVAAFTRRSSSRRARSRRAKVRRAPRNVFFPPSSQKLPAAASVSPHPTTQFPPVRSQRRPARASRGAQPRPRRRRLEPPDHRD